MKYKFMLAAGAGVVFGEASIWGEDLKFDYGVTVFRLSDDHKQVSVGKASDILSEEHVFLIRDNVFNGVEPAPARYSELCAIAGTMLMAHAANLLASGGHISDTAVTIDGQPYRDALAAANGLLNAPGSRLLLMSKNGLDINPAIGNMEGLVYHCEPVDQYQLSDFSGLS